MDISWQLFSRLSWHESSNGQSRRVLPWLPLEKEIVLQRLMPPLVLLSLLPVASFFLCRLQACSCREALRATWCVLQNFADATIAVIFWSAANFGSRQTWLIAIFLLAARCLQLAGWKQFFLGWTCLAGAVILEIRRGGNSLFATGPSHALLLACMLLLLQAWRPSRIDAGSCQANLIRESQTDLAPGVLKPSKTRSARPQGSTVSTLTGAIRPNAMDQQRQKQTQQKENYRQQPALSTLEQSGHPSHRSQRSLATSGEPCERTDPLLSDAVRTSLEMKQSRLSGRPPVAEQSASRKAYGEAAVSQPATTLRVRRGGHSPRQQLMTGKENIFPGGAAAKQLKDRDAVSRSSQICFPQKSCAGGTLRAPSKTSGKIYVDDEFAETQNQAADVWSLCELVDSGHEEAMAMLRRQLARLPRQR
mmetsp:Transcript_89474/g.158827  ORF Transcript_89474/g.158827 Transcript_89474/m.158827 type:complete len:420 (+) Transcript_89474:35-1294(+)